MADNKDEKTDFIDKAIPTSVSIYQSDLNALNEYAIKYKIKTQAKLFRIVIRGFLKQIKKDTTKDVVNHFLYPIIIGTFASVGTLWTQKLMNILQDKGLFFADLLDFHRFFVILGALSIGLIIANIYWLKKKHSV